MWVSKKSWNFLKNFSGKFWKMMIGIGLVSQLQFYIYPISRNKSIGPRTWSVFSFKSFFTFFNGQRQLQPLFGKEAFQNEIYFEKFIRFQCYQLHSLQQLIFVLVDECKIVMNEFHSTWIVHDFGKKAFHALFLRCLVSKCEFSKGLFQLTLANEW